MEIPLKIKSRMVFPSSLDIKYRFRPARVAVGSCNQQYFCPANMADKKTMKAVVFDGPHKVSIQDRPIPKCTLSSVHGTLTNRAAKYLFIADTSSDLS